MSVRPGRVAPRKEAQKPLAYRTITIPAPALGIVANNNLATPQPGGAHTLENFIPTSTGARLRRGSQRHAVVGTDGSPITAMFEYANGNNRSKFVATATALYDVTTPVYADDHFMVDELGTFLLDDDGNFVIIPGTPDVAEDGFTGGAWSTVQFATAGGVFLRLVNGTDTPLVYDGATFSTSPALTSADLSFDPQNLSYVWAHQQRLFFVEKDTLSAWYLPSDAIGGAVVELPLAGVFDRGGSLLFGATWSLETGGGLSEQCIFVSTEGEVAVFQGTDPNSVGTWSKVGLYKIGKPLGPNAHFRAGGDIVIATDIGMIPLSQALQKDFAVLSQTAISASIDALWNEEVKARAGSDWNCTVWSRNQIAIVQPPKLSGQSAVMYVVNTRTGAWAKITGWDATKLLVYEDRLFFGTSVGRVIEANVTGIDGVQTYTGIYVPLFSDFDVAGMKTTGMTRTVLRAFAPMNDQLTMQREFGTDLPPPPSATSVSASNSWGEAIWGQAIWGAGLVKATYAKWRSTPENGSSLAPALQVTSGSTAPLDAEIVKTDVTFITGETLT